MGRRAQAQFPLSAVVWIANNVPNPPPFPPPLCVPLLEGGERGLQGLKGSKDRVGVAECTSTLDICRAILGHSPDLKGNQNSGQSKSSCLWGWGRGEHAHFLFPKNTMKFGGKSGCSQVAEKLRVTFVSQRGLAHSLGPHSRQTGSQVLTPHSLGACLHFLRADRGQPGRDSSISLCYRKELPGARTEGASCNG